MLGAHAYGARIEAMRAAFGAHAKDRRTSRRPALDSFVAVALERPLLFVGLSLSREEWTIWWLLSQRARYRKDLEPLPALAVVTRPKKGDRQQEAHHASLERAAEIVGLELLVADDHPTGWQNLRKALRW